MARSGTCGHGLIRESKIPETAADGLKFGCLSGVNRHTHTSTHRSRVLVRFLARGRFFRRVIRKCWLEADTHVYPVTDGAPVRLLVTIFCLFEGDLGVSDSRECEHFAKFA